MSDFAVQGFRLSPQQKHLWLLQKEEADYPFGAQLAVLLQGDLDTERLQTALQRVVERHEILRTRFRCLPGVAIPLQVITEQGTLLSLDYDWTGLDPQQQAKAIDIMFREMRHQSFDLEQGSALDSRLIKLSPVEHLLLLRLPALCADLVTLKNLISEIARQYSTFLAETELPPVELQYPDFSEFLNDLLEAEETKAGRDYWQRQNRSDWMSAKLPFESDSRVSSGFEPEVLCFPVDAHTAERLRETADERDLSVADLLMATWQVLLWRITGESEGILGAACDGRNYEGMQTALGLFSRYLPLRYLLEDRMPFSQLARQAHESTREAYEWQEYFKWEQSAESFERKSGDAFYPFSFDYEEPEPAQSVGELAFSLYKQYICTDSFKLRLSCVAGTAELRTDFYYDADLFVKDDICHLARLYHTLLESMVNDPDAAIYDLNLVNQAERHRLLFELNNTTVKVDYSTYVHKVFEAQVEQVPEATALVYQGFYLTYAELNARANQLARQLQEQGVAPEVLVALCVEPSLETVIGMLAILKAGGAYLPLDPSYPAERLAYMIEDSKARVLLTQRQLMNGLPPGTATVICLNDLRTAPQRSGENLQVEVCQENLAYMIYTSGSTGRPKGVMISHRALINHMAWMTKRFLVTEDDSVLQKTPFSFDASVWEFYLPLLTGGRLIIGQSGGHRDGNYLVSLIRQEQVSLLQLVPSQLRIVQEESGWTNCQSLRQVFCGGEALDSELVNQHFSRQQAPLCNLYGPTEATIDTTYYFCEAQANTTTAPIGVPIDNVQLHLLDSRLEPLPAGVIGELYVGGTGLGRGYANQPAFTSERFIPNPFSQTPGERLYRTGDLARLRADGSYEFIGRSDHQVKIRGFRIELGEIEAALGSHPAIRHSVVLAREDTAGDFRLVAYSLLAESQAIPSDAELRSFIQARLPDYMIPSYFVTLDALPLTPSGKLDRRALPPPAQEPQAKPPIDLAPQTIVEEVLSGIFCDVLGVGQVSTEDDFFAIGGHSLLATMAVTRAREAFQTDVQLQWIFDAPTVAGFARKIEQAMRAAHHSPSPPVKRASRESELPLSFAQERLWFITRLLPESPAYNLPDSIHIKGPLHLETLAQALGEIIRRHEILRTTYTVKGARPVQVIESPRPLLLPRVDLSGLTGSQQQAQLSMLSRQEARRPFNLAHNLMLRGTAVCLAEQEYVLLFTLHHISSDAWSRGVLIREVSALYEAFSAGISSALPELSIQYSDFAAWQRQWLQGDALDAELDYWKQKLKGNRADIDLPMKQPRQPMHSFPGASHALLLSAELTEQLRAFSRSKGVTLFMTLLAAFKVLLYRYSGQEDISVGTAISNRSRSEFEKLIGFFINTLVLRTELSPVDSFNHLLTDVRQATLEAYAHQDLPFEKLVEELQPQRNTSQNALFNVAFGFVNAAQQTLQVPGLTAKGLATESGTAKFDITFLAVERENGLATSMEYNADLFNGTLILTMLRQFRNLLEAIIARPESSIASLSLLGEAERQQILLEWNQTEAAYPSDVCVHTLFEQQAARAPDAIALVYGDEHISYRSLNERANQLAHQLRRLAVKPESRVCIYLERSLELIVALLGTLKAGGAYVPLDPTYPTDRLLLMLEDTEASVLVTRRGLAEEFPQHLTKILRIDADRQEIAQRSTENLFLEMTAENLAYVIYTSGSTGKPKGVCVPHKAINRLVFSARYMDFGPSEKIAQVSNSSFDAATFEIWGALLHGGRLVGVSREVTLSPKDFARQIHSHELSAFFLTTALFNQFVMEIPEMFATVNHLLVGGDAVDPKWARKVLACGAPERLLNGYGPTESTTFACWHLIAEVAENATTIPIGRPLGNTKAYILDKSMELVAIGVSGELYIGGDGLAREYLNHPELTADKFIPNPFGELPGQRLYRTGDRTRHSPDGNIEFFGRLDNQVKIRGFRIEPGEIETLLKEHRRLQDAVVIVRTPAAGEKQIVAYVVVEPKMPVTVDELRQFLRQKLPDYMIPAAFVMLDSLPLTANGKVDRKALPAPEASYQEACDYIAPASELEEAIAVVWKSVLQINQVGIHDNFFDLGGHSLLLIRVESQLRLIVAREFSILDLFEYPTIHALAQYLSRQEGAQASSQEIDEQPEKKREGPSRLAQRRTRMRPAVSERVGD
jgi:amino acid adenylation domain-containing protein